MLEELSIELTNACTLSCLHCSSGSTMEKLRDELTPIEYVSLITQAKELGATVLSLSGGNPLLCDWLDELIDYADELGYERILLYTTGHNHAGHYVWQYPKVRHLMDCNKLTWIFSLHSHKAAVNDWIMDKEGVTLEITSSIDWLVNDNQCVEVHMVPMRPNFRHIPDVRNLCQELGVDRLSLLRFVPQTRGKLNDNVLGLNKVDFAWLQTIIAVELDRNHPVQMRAGCPIDFRHAMGFVKTKANVCHAGDDLMLIRPNGDVHPCAAWKSLPSDANVRKMDLEDIWHNSETFKYVRWFKDGGYKSVTSCRHCTKVKSCKTGCLAQRLHAYGIGCAERDHLGVLLCEYGDPLCPIGIARLVKDYGEKQEV